MRLNQECYVPRQSNEDHMQYCYVLYVICYQLPTQSTPEAMACVLSDLKMFSKTAARSLPMPHPCQHVSSRQKSLVNAAVAVC